MNLIEASIFLLLLAVLSVPLATRFRLPLEVFLVIGSCLISLLPSLPQYQINPVIVFNLFLPPILFAAAYFTSWRDFKFNLRPISLLAFGLVICTAGAVAIVAKLIFPGFSWAEGFLLGAIVSPSDASAATAIIRKLGAPRRVITILEGESLVNDATALIMYRFSLAAIMQGYFYLPSAVSKFFVIVIGGVIIGIIISYLALFTFRKLHDIRAETTLTFITAYTSYLVAEHFGFSGVISTVVSGIYFGMRFPEYATSQTRINAKASWNTLLFVINGFAFTLIGLELPWVMAGLQSYKLSNLVLYGLAISLVVIIVRLLFVYPAAYVPRALIPAIRRRDPMPTWGTLLVIGSTGMRGIVSLAAVLAIPRFLPSGEPFPNLALLIFLIYCVIVATLIPPAIILPMMLRALHLTETEDKMREEATARVRAMEGIIERITEIAKRENIPCDILNEFRNQIERRLGVIKTQLDPSPYSVISREYMATKRLAISAIESERETIIKLRRSGEIHDEIFRLLSDELDIEEVRVKGLRI